MIEAVGLNKAFGSRHAVRDVSVVFPAQSVSYLLGLNGAGKTTLLRLISGLTQPDTGTVRVCGRRLDHGGNPMRLLGSALDPTVMDPKHTVRRHLTWLAALGGISSTRIDEVLSEAGITAVGARRISTLSTGARQRLSIAGALLGEPAVVILDEPLNGLDVPAIVWFRQLLRRLADEGRTVVVASHLLSEVVLTADRIVQLGDGRVVADGTLEELVPAGADPREHLERAVMAAGSSGVSP